MSYPIPSSRLNDYCHQLSDLMRTASARVDQMDASIEEDQGFSVSVRQGQLETCESQGNKKLVITVYKNKKTGTASTTDLSVSAMQMALDKAIAIASFTESDPYAGLVNAELMAQHIPDLKQCYEWSIDQSQATALALACDEQVLAYDSHMVAREGTEVSTSQGLYAYANTHGFVGGYRSSYHCIVASAVAQDDQGMQSAYEYTASCDPERLLPVEQLGVKAAEKTVKLLSARKVATQRCPVIFSAPMAKSLLASLMSAISGGVLYRQSSFLQDALGTRIFPEFIDVMQRPHMPSAIGSMPFDNDGVATRDIDYVVGGVLNSYVLGGYSSRQLGMQTTGNAGGVFNLQVSTQVDSLSALCQKMGKGLLVTDLMGQGVNILTGDYSRGVRGFWVENGEIQFPVHEVTIASNLKDMFLSIVAVANDVDTRGNIQTGSILIEEMTLAGD